MGLKYFYRILRLKGTDKYFLAKKSNKLSDLRRLGLFLLETFIFFYIITQLVIFDKNKNKNESDKSIYFLTVSIINAFNGILIRIKCYKRLLKKVK